MQRINQGLGLLERDYSVGLKDKRLVKRGLKLVVLWVERLVP